MAISGSEQAYTSARAGIARSGATRSNYIFPSLPGVVLVGGVDYTARILYGSLHVHLEINDKPDTCSFSAFINGSDTQSNLVVGVDVQIGLGSAFANPIFGGRIVTAQTARNAAGVASLRSVMCADFLQVLDSETLITYDWPSQSATTTILDLVARFANKPGGVSISTAGVELNLPVHQAFGVINERFSTVLRRMVTMFPTPGGFYVDARKVLRCWTGKPEPGHTAPTVATLANTHIKQFAELVDGTPVRDAVIVEGARTSAPIGTGSSADYATLPVTFPVVDASILGRVTDQSGRELRVGSQRLVMRYAQGPWSPPDNSPTASSVTADVAYDPTAGGNVVINVSNSAFLLGRTFPCWVKIGEQYLVIIVAGGLAMQVPRLGFGSLSAPIKAGATITAVDSISVGTVTGRYNAPGSTEKIRAQPIDADVVMVVRSSTTPGIHEQIVQDGRYVRSGATNRGQHEVQDFAAPAKSIQFETTDLNAMPGRVQVYSFVEPPLETMAGELMIITTDISWPVWGALPVRTCTAANIGAADIVDAWVVDPR